MSLDPYLPPDQRRLLSRFWESASGFWRGRSAWRAWFLVAVMVITVFLQLWAQYRLNFWNRDFFNAIGRKDGTELWRQAMLFVPIAAASISLVIFSVWARMTTQREWREWLSSHLYGFWLGGGRYRRLRFMLGEHQTPEYRIAEDAKVATDVPVDLVVGLLSSVLNAITFIGVLWSVGGSFVVPFFGQRVSIPGYLVLAVVAYSALVTAAMMFIGRHLMRVLAESKRAEADLRAIGAHLRESGEGSAPPDARTDGRQVIGPALAKGDCPMARAVRATDADDAGFADQSAADASDRIAALHAEISGRADEPRRSRSGGRGIHHRAGGVQLDHRQLRPPCGVEVVCQPGRIPPARAGYGRHIGPIRDRNPQHAQG
ncbi:SbmA/BacA-like family transporter [Xanthobacter autotrophicus]|uniref:SbmA/BacA-like family transporter n=1 Tax=Xanthobacter autotrophicus TaxID=280 RepID=UPI00372A9F7A